MIEAKELSKLINNSNKIDLFVAYFIDFFNKHHLEFRQRLIIIFF